MRLLLLMLLRWSKAHPAAAWWRSRMVISLTETLIMEKLSLSLRSAAGPSSEMILALMHGRTGITAAIFLSSRKLLKIRNIRVEEPSMDFNKLHSRFISWLILCSEVFYQSIRARLQHGGPHTPTLTSHLGARDAARSAGEERSRKHSLFLYNVFWLLSACSIFTAT